MLSFLKVKLFCANNLLFDTPANLRKHTLLSPSKTVVICVYIFLKLGKKNCISGLERLFQSFIVS